MRLYVAQSGKAVLAFFALAHAAAQDVRHKLLPVTDAEYSAALGKNSRIDGGTAGLIHAVGSAGND